MLKNVVIINKLEQLLPYLNDKGVLEIATRGKNQRFTKFINLAIEKAPSQNSASKVLEYSGKVFGGGINPFTNTLNLAANGANVAIGLKNLQMIKHLTNLVNINLVMSGANLFATCAGFAVMNQKLEEVSESILSFVNTYKEDQKLNIDYKFNTIVSDYSNMLDCREKQNSYNENKMWQLVSDEYNYLKLLLDIFKSNYASKPKELVFIILSLAEMLSASLCYYNELYYHNNSKIRNRHTDYDKWLSVFDSMLEKSFIEKIQDYSFFDLGLCTTDVDCYYKSFVNQINESKQAVVDNQYIIELLKKHDLIQTFHDFLDESTNETIREAFKKDNIDDNELYDVFHDTMVQLKIA